MKSGKTGRAVLALVCLAALGLSVGAPELRADDIRRERVAFREGTTGATLNGRLVGRETTDYLLAARAGQSMMVNLVSDNLAAYFNVIAPGADTALFIGNLGGGYFEGTLPANGDYTVRVYMMRSAGRRGETADYTIDFRIEDDESALQERNRSWEIEGIPHAAGFLPCSALKPGLDRECRYRVIRDDGGARLWISGPNDTDSAWYRLYRFENSPGGRFTTEGEMELTWERQGDDWWLDLAGSEFYRVPDRVLFGCDTRGMIRCSFDDPSLGAQCGFQAFRQENGAEIRLEVPVGTGGAGQRVLFFWGTPPAFEDAVITTGDGIEVPWVRRDDGWMVVVDDREYYLIPDALILGD